MINCFDIAINGLSVIYSSSMEIFKNNLFYHTHFYLYLQRHIESGKQTHRLTEEIATYQEAFTNIIFFLKKAIK